MDSQTWAAIFGAGGLGAVLLTLVKGILDWLSGKHSREKDRNVDILAQRNDAWKERDAERKRANCERIRADAEHRRRRQLSEYASELRSLLLEKGVPTDDLPDWPPYFTPTDEQ